MSTQNLLDKKSGQSADSAWGNGDGFRLFRDTLESLAAALVLALLFKTFLIELYVIPTGSMAPTLMGFHKDVVCPQCKTRYKVNASEEFPEATGHGQSSSDESQNARVLGGTCPQCGTTAYLGKDNVDNVDYRSYSGDRILVAKYNYLFRQPKRWHVTVFRYPAKAQVNYVKRLVGLENETVRIQNGDVFVRKDGETDFVIQRKPLRELNSMLQLVHDTEHAIPEWDSRGYPSAWQADEDSNAVFDNNKTFATSLKNPTTVTEWIHYRHIVPSSEECLKLAAGALPSTAVTAKPMLITDFTSYNSGLVRNSQGMRRQASDFIAVREQHDGKKVVRDYQCYRDPDYMGLNWVGDLAVSFDITTTEKVVPADSGLFVKLVKGGVVFVCKIDLRTGDAELSIEGMEDVFEPVHGKTNVKGESCHRVMFMNIDEELRLCVNGKEVTFNRPARYDSLIDVENRMRRDRSPTELDLRPISIGVRGAEVTIARMKVQRDLYYLAANDNDNSWMCDLLNSPFASYLGETEQHNRNILSSQEFFKYFGKTKQVDFKVGHDEFLMLGDNSPMSKDSRLWTRDGIPAPVPRELLVGEALLVYWPHGLPLPFVPLNIIPNVKQMRFID
ncbi:MAG: S26 family signal peptidase [Planctomycetaceae bacterium]|jgi:signal peptidase I|nr:S26 family signal peptidase [Planctomycetaceae bacterium]